MSAIAGALRAAVAFAATSAAATGVLAGDGFRGARSAFAGADFPAGLDFLSDLGRAGRLAGFFFAAARFDGTATAATVPADRRLVAAGALRVGDFRVPGFFFAGADLPVGPVRLSDFGRAGRLAGFFFATARFDGAATAATVPADRRLVAAGALRVGDFRVPGFFFAGADLPVGPVRLSDFGRAGDLAGDLAVGVAAADLDGAATLATRRAGRRRAGFTFISVTAWPPARSHRQCSVRFRQ